MRRRLIVTRPFLKLMLCVLPLMVAGKSHAQSSVAIFDGSSVKFPVEVDSHFYNVSTDPARV